MMGSWYIETITESLILEITNQYWTYLFSDVYFSLIFQGQYTNDTLSVNICEYDVNVFPLGCGQSFLQY